MHRVNSQRGQALLLVMIAMVPICLALGLVVDVGMAYYTKTSARAAAQMAALAAVQRAMDLVYQGATYSCGASNLGCELSPTACTSNPPLNLQSACSYAQANGFSLGNVWVDANTTPPPVSGAPSVQYWVRVQILQPNALTFGIFSGLQQLNVAASAVAAAANMLSPNCVVALDHSANNALSLNGNVTLQTVSCGIAVDSNSNSALSVTGNITMSAPSIAVTGRCSGCNGSNVHVSPAPTTGVQPAPDPLEGVPAPQVPSGCDHTNLSFGGNTNTTLQPGTYCGGISVSGNASVTFNPGTYYLVGGGLTASGNTTLIGSSVTFYNTFNSSYAFRPVSLTGNVTLQVSAPSSGSLKDMLFFEDRHAPSGNANTITGNASMDIKGAIYFPRNALTIDGNASNQQLIMVADTIGTSGNATNLTIDPNAGATPITPQISAALIQ